MNVPEANANYPIIFSQWTEETRNSLFESRSRPSSFFSAVHNGIKASVIDVGLETAKEAILIADRIKWWGEQLLFINRRDEKFSVKYLIVSIDISYQGIAKTPMTIGMIPVKLAYQLFMTIFYPEQSYPWGHADEVFRVHLYTKSLILKIQKNLYDGVHLVAEYYPLRSRLLAIPVSILDIGLDALKWPLGSVEYAFWAAVHMLAAPFFAKYTVKKSLLLICASLNYSAAAIVAYDRDIAGMKVAYQMFFTVLDPRKAKSWSDY